MDLLLVNRPGVTAVVDEEDFVWLSQHRWRLGAKGYVLRTARPWARYLHREILGLEPGDPRRAEHMPYSADAR